MTDHTQGRHIEELETRLPTKGVRSLIYSYLLSKRCPLVRATLFSENDSTVAIRGSDYGHYDVPFYWTFGSISPNELDELFRQDSKAKVYLPEEYNTTALPQSICVNKDLVFKLVASEKSSCIGKLVALDSNFESLNIDTDLLDHLPPLEAISSTGLKIYALEVGGVVVSIVDLTVSDDSSVLVQMLHTSQRYRRMGYGKSLIRHIVNLLHDEKKIIYYICDEKNTPSKKLARKCGFKEVGSLPLANFK